MRLKLLFTLCAFAACLPSIGLPASIETYARGPAIRSVHLSPDGTMLLYSTFIGDDRHIIVQTIDDRKPIADINLGKQALRDVQWAGSQRLLIMTLQDDPVPNADPNRNLKMVVKTIDLISHKSIDLLMDIPKGVNIVGGSPSVRLTDGGGAKAILTGPYMEIDRTSSSLALFEADLVDGKTKLLSSSDPEVHDWQADRNGQPMAQVRYNSNARHWDVTAKHGNSWVSIAGGDGFMPRFVGLTADGAAPILRFPSEFGFTLKSVGMDGVIRDVVPGGGYTSILSDPSSQRVYGALRYHGDVREYRFIDAADQARWTAITKAYPADDVDWGSVSQDGKRLAILVRPKNETPYYALVDLTTGKSRVVSDQYAGLPPADVSPSTKLEFIAADGMKIDGYLTAPRGKSAKSLPLVVVTPPAYASWSIGGFDSLDQALAAQGYAVLHVNYRGLPGGGLDPARTVVGEFGDKSLGDISAAIRQLAAAGTIDPGRVCVFGSGNLGGYTALALVVREPAAYRCAISEDGMFNLKDSFQMMDHNTTEDWLKRFGVKRIGDPRLTAISPYSQVDKIKAPVMLFVEAEDKTFYGDQVRAMSKALQRTGGKVELVNVQGNNEAQSTPSADVKRAQTIIAFIEKNNPPN